MGTTVIRWHTRLWHLTSSGASKAIPILLHPAVTFDPLLVGEGHLPLCTGQLNV